MAPWCWAVRVFEGQKSQIILVFCNFVARSLFSLKFMVVSLIPGIQ